MLNALFYPKVKFDELYIPYIYKEIYFDGVYVDVLNQKKDMTVIDVGANIGIVTDYMRPYAKKIYSIEPSTEHFEALKKNKEYNKWDNVEIFKMAIADKDGEMNLSLNEKNRTCHSLTLDYKQGGEMVKTMRFDTFLKENKIKEVDFCKFDVEGAEDMILRSEGFINVADKFKAIEVEFHFPTFPQLIEHMQKLGFQARRFDCSAVIVLFFR
jgi:FkbM family methyltransferase